MRIKRCLAASLLALLLLFLASCARLPEYARPKKIETDELAGISMAGFRYRKLTIADFKASELPGKSRHHQGMVSAQSCLRIRPAASTNAFIRATQLHGSQVFAGHFTEIAFEALFIPECSWWNPAISPKRIAYVLQHEQIHFAISEMTARKASRNLQQELQDYTAFGSSVDEVKKELMQKLSAAAAEIIEQDLKTHTDFDSETSMTINPAGQREWLRKTVNRLGITEAPAKK